MKASEFDRKFEDGENILADLNISQANLPREKTKHGEKNVGNVLVLCLQMLAKPAAENTPVRVILYL